MNRAQKRRVRNWIIITGFLIAASGLFLAPEAYWRGLASVLSIAGAIWIALSPEIRNEQKGLGPDNQPLPVFIERYPWLKFWLVGYCALFVPWLIHQLLIQGANNPESQYWWYFIPILGIIAPVIAVSEYKRFQHEGEFGE